MADGLVIKDDVVSSFIQDCSIGLSTLRSAQLFNENMAQAAGTNGGLAGALTEVDGTWSIRRGKLIDAFETLLKTISETRAKYGELDKEMAKLLTPPSASGGGTSTDPSAPSPEQSTPSDARATQDEVGGGGSSGGASPAPMASGGSTVAGGGSGSGPGAALPDLPSVDDGDSSILSAGAKATPIDEPAMSSASEAAAGGADGSAALDALVSFAGRWASLTGQTEAQVIALLVAGMGAAGLIPATLLAELGKRAGGGGADADASTDDAVAAVDGTDAGEGTSSGGGAEPVPGDTDSGVQDGEVAVDEPGTSSDEGDAAPADGDEPDGDAEGASAPEGAPETDDGLAPSDVAAPGVAAQVEADLQAEAPELTAPPVALPELADTAAAEEAGAAGGSGGGASGAGVELPPLDAATDDVTEVTSASGGVELPDLASPASDAGAPVAEADLPGLEADVKDSPTLMATGGMRGTGGMGVASMGAGGAGATNSASSSPSGGVQEDARRRDARDVLELTEEER